MARDCFFIMMLLFLSVFLHSCGSEGGDGSDGDADLDQEPEFEAPPPVDCEYRRSEINPENQIKCTKWCSKVSQCGGGDPLEECIRDCRAMSWELIPEPLQIQANCIDVTSCTIYAQERDKGDTSRNLEIYCRNKVTMVELLAPDRDETCQLAYENLLECKEPNATTFRDTCKKNYALMFSDETFQRYAVCSEIICDNTAWGECLGICHLLTDVID